MVSEGKLGEGLGTRLLIAGRECIEQTRNMPLPFLYRWAAGIPGGNGDQGRAWPDSAGPQREQFHSRTRRWGRGAPGSLPEEERGFRQVGIKYTAQFPDLRLVWEWGYTCSFNLQLELIFPQRGSTLAEKDKK